MFRDEIPAPETQETPPGARGDGRLSRQRLPPVESARARAAAYRHLMLLSDATARYDDLNEGQLGDVLFEDGRTVVAIFGSKCDRCGAGKPAALPAASEPGSVLHPRASGYGNVAGRGAGSRTSPLRGPHLLRTIRASAVLAGRANGPGGERREGARREPEDACQLKERGDVPEQPWPGDREAGGGGGAFPRWRAASPRRAGAATRLRAVGRVVHLESAKLTAVAAAPRMQGSGRPAGAAAKPVGRFDELPPPPPAEGLRLLPAGAPQHGGPLGARMPGGVTPVGGV